MLSVSELFKIKKYKDICINYQKQLFSDLSINELYMIGISYSFIHEYKKSQSILTSIRNHSASLPDFYLYFSLINYKNGNLNQALEFIKHKSIDNTSTLYFELKVELCLIQKDFKNAQYFLKKSKQHLTSLSINLLIYESVLMLFNQKTKEPLLNIIKSCQPNKGVEVGVWKGDWAFDLLTNINSINQLYMVDPYDYDSCIFEHKKDSISGIPHSSYMQKNQYLNTMGFSKSTINQPFLDDLFKYVTNQVSEKFPNRATVMRLKSEIAAKKFNDQELDFVYIDAIHLYDYVKEDISFWINKVKPGGIICGDDYSFKFPGVIKAVYSTFGDKLKVFSRNGNNNQWAVFL